MARSLHPLACRIGRAERAQIVQFARERGMSVSGLLKVAVRQYIAAQPTIVAQPVVHPEPVNRGVNRLTDLLSSPPLARPFRVPRARQSHGSAVGGERKKVWLSDF